MILGWIAVISGAVLLCQNFCLAEASSTCKRIIPLAPSIAEIVYDIGIGDAVVGVTRYSSYPKDVLTKPKVGGFLDPSFEAILKLEPDLVIALTEHGEKIDQLKALGLDVAVVNHKTVSGILSSYPSLGERCGVESQALLARSKLETGLSKVNQRVGKLPKVRALVVIGGSRASDWAKSVFVSGSDGFYAELLDFAGGENVYTGPTIGLATLSLESIVNFAPEAILEIAAEAGEAAEDPEKLKQSWGQFPALSAVKNNRIYVFQEEYFTIPGPRMIKVAQAFAAALHPELTWHD